MTLKAINIPNEVLGAFNPEITPIFSQIQLLGLTNETLRKTRDLLLPKLISGELDVSELDIDIGEYAA